MPGRAALGMKAKESRKSNSWILKLGVQRYLGSIWCTTQSRFSFPVSTVASRLTFSFPGVEVIERCKVQQFPEHDFQGVGFFWC